jgi:hypothetical protein
MGKMGVEEEMNKRRGVRMYSRKRKEITGRIRGQEERVAKSK